MKSCSWCELRKPFLSKIGMKIELNSRDHALSSDGYLLDMNVPVQLLVSAC